jgi:hypothetical protein
MSILRRPVFRRYLLGLAVVAASAGVADAVDSMWPLALGAAFAVMCTADLVRDIRRRHLRER